ncbi:MAG: Carbohydrate-binding protein [Candidatus Collierbacteria bacterium GW2011_GWC2_43_12]|uniref:Carbohydrate-binding protein n=1 Tax=Candidatus Collierbacteria bacterium GW2011_GWC2_43_12 TaxID=1618390 RepID=A0A0G1D2A6_9BACT|nr:MAG: Carbohydrate-binding protein [Candidatus Collierbacteria bacterium GW2011_GWC2_43_12]
MILILQVILGVEKKELFHRAKYFNHYLNWVIRNLYLSASESFSFYVSPTGNDSNPGTLASPFKTIKKAKEAVRTVNDGSQDVTCPGGRIVEREN